LLEKVAAGFLAAGFLNTVGCVFDGTDFCSCTTLLDALSKLSDSSFHCVLQVELLLL